MDVMELRRRIIEAMASGGAEVIKGTFIADGGQANSYTLSWGKKFSKYIYIIEMTEDSKNALISSGQTSAKMYACIGKYPMPSINNDSLNNTYLSNRIIPSTQALSVSNTTNNVSDTVTGNSIKFTCNRIGSGANVLYNNYSYNYTIVSLDDI